ncbi:MAG: hypothetical protein IJS15_02180, partial [Victivallales bacterium]|nr:hypothetical protein [Victivallales bacterium]
MKETVIGRGNAVSGMPLYFLCEYYWCKLFGYSEYALRSMNFISAILFLVGAQKLIQATRLPLWSLAIFVTNPVFLYYMNEARPYAAILTCGLWCLYYLHQHLSQSDSNSLLKFLMCFWIGCALHLMFVFMGAVYALTAFWLLLQKKLHFRQHLLAWAIFALPFLLLAWHYLRFAFNAPEVNAQAKPVASIIQIGYYFAGLGGLAWSRNALRSMNLEFSVRILIELSIVIIAYCFVLFHFIRQQLFKNSTIAFTGAGMAVSMILFIAANVVMKTRFWERHIAYLIPGMMVLLSMVCYDIMKNSQSSLMKTLAVLLLLLQALSGINI